MLYKTITLSLIEQHPQLHERLRQSRTLLSTMNQVASELKENHEAWKERLSQSRPGSDPIQIDSEAMEIAVAELEERLASKSRRSETEPFSHDEAMNPIRRHIPPA